MPTCARSYRLRAAPGPNCSCTPRNTASPVDRSPGKGSARAAVRRSRRPPPSARRLLPTGVGGARTRGGRQVMLLDSRHSRVSSEPPLVGPLVAPARVHRDDEVTGRSSSRASLCALARPRTSAGIPDRTPPPVHDGGVTYSLVLQVPGLTTTRCTSMRRELEERGLWPPDQPVSHACAEIDSGLEIAEVWADRGAAERFVASIFAVLDREDLRVLGREGVDR